jgi:hypothetical protein
MRGAARHRSTPDSFSLPSQGTARTARSGPFVVLLIESGRQYACKATAAEASVSRSVRAGCAHCLPRCSFPTVLQHRAKPSEPSAVLGALAVSPGGRDIRGGRRRPRRDGAPARIAAVPLAPSGLVTWLGHCGPGGRHGAFHLPAGAHEDSVTGRSCSRFRRGGDTGSSGACPCVMRRQRLPAWPQSP